MLLLRQDIGGQVPHDGIGVFKVCECLCRIVCALAHLERPRNSPHLVGSDGFVRLNWGLSWGLVVIACANKKPLSPCGSQNSWYADKEDTSGLPIHPRAFTNNLISSVNRGIGGCVVEAPSRVAALTTVLGAISERGDYRAYQQPRRCV